MTLPTLNEPASSVYPQLHSHHDPQRPRRYALIPTHDRPVELARLVGQLEPWADIIVIIDNASNPAVSEVELRAAHPATSIIVIECPDQPPNLYHMWNLGFDAIHLHAEAQVPGTGRRRLWDVAVLNDDTLLPDGWADYVSANLRDPAAAGAAAASTYPFVHCQASEPPVWLKKNHDGNIGTRMCPWAFILRGEAGLRADENFGWWWGDTDLDWQACVAGGVLLLPGPVPANTLANSTTVGVLAEQAGRDGLYFAAKWGRRPW
jgi:hypothetical protein